ncbi:MAG TPA: hypothetical protein VNZ45_07780 [Bacteroidia bacterium]|jgi:hypothetical protein|nr:hypothetical protein [Bacteroidia bacterium]
MLNKLTGEDVLNIFIEQHRLCSPLDPETDESAEFTMDTSIDEWVSANDLLPWYSLYRYLNEEFHISATEEEWYEQILTPESKGTLKDLCEFIAKRSQTGDIKSIKLFGKDCISAAIFLTLKRNLERMKVDVSELRPSSSVIPYLEKYFGEMVAQTTLVSRGGKVFDTFKIKVKKKGFFNYINIFDPNRYTFLTGEIQTFRDLTLKIMEINSISESQTSV